LLVAFTRVRTDTAVKDVKWGTLAFFMGLVHHGRQAS
jgi:Na+/H+ antiporter NhaD/arsenite permease-like protein